MFLPPIGGKSFSGGSSPLYMPVVDDIWRSVPEDRLFDERLLAFALGALGELPEAGRPPRVADLGCGDGRYAAKLVAAGFDVTGVDASREALERARAAHPELQLVSPEPDGALPFAD